MGADVPAGVSALGWELAGPGQEACGEELHLHLCFQPLSPHTEAQGGLGLSWLERSALQTAPVPGLLIEVLMGTREGAGLSAGHVEARWWCLWGESTGCGQRAECLIACLGDPGGQVPGWWEASCYPGGCGVRQVGKGWGCTCRRREVAGGPQAPSIVRQRLQHWRRDTGDRQVGGRRRCGPQVWGARATRACSHPLGPDGSFPPRRAFLSVSIAETTVSPQSPLWMEPWGSPTGPWLLGTSLPSGPCSGAQVPPPAA